MYRYVKNTRTDKQLPQHTFLPGSVGCNSALCVQHMLAGAVAGISEHVAMYPMDTIKTRMQALGHPGQRVCCLHGLCCCACSCRVPLQSGCPVACDASLLPATIYYKPCSPAAARINGPPGCRSRDQEGGDCRLVWWSCCHHLGRRVSHQQLQTSLP